MSFPWFIGDVVFFILIFLKTLSIEVMSGGCLLIPDTVIIWDQLQHVSLLLLGESKFISVHHCIARVQLRWLTFFKESAYGHRQICWIFYSKIWTVYLLLLNSKVDRCLTERVSLLVQQLVLAFVQIWIWVRLILLLSPWHLTFLRLTHRFIRRVRYLGASLSNAELFTMPHILRDIGNWVLGSHFHVGMQTSVVHWWQKALALNIALRYLTSERRLLRIRLRKRNLLLKATACLNEWVIVVVRNQTSDLLFLYLLDSLYLAELLPISHDLSFLCSKLQLIAFQHLLQYFYFVGFVLEIKLNVIHLFVLELFKARLLEL